MGTPFLASSSPGQRYYVALPVDDMFSQSDGHTLGFARILSYCICCCRRCFYLLLLHFISLGEPVVLHP